MAHHVSRCMVKPHPPTSKPGDPRRRCHLTPWDLAMLSPHYIQKGLLFPINPSSSPSITDMVDRLKTSLSTALHIFYPLAGRFIVEKQYTNDGNGNRTSSGIFISIDCNDEGAEFILAMAKSITVAQVLDTTVDVPSLVQSFFPMDGAVNYDGRTLPLLAIQLTELADGVFVACSFNHMVGDGTSYWDFFNSWAEISRSRKFEIVSNDGAILDRWFMDGIQAPIKLPFAHEDEFIERFSSPVLRERIFHFSAKSMAAMKARANEECGTINKISSFQALSALMWVCITRSRRFPPDQTTDCRVAIQNRTRLHPPLPPDYFGNSIYSIRATAKAGEMLERGFGWTAMRVHELVAAHTDEAIRGMLQKWVAAPMVYKLSMFRPVDVVLGSSPRFDMYGCDFGWGRAVAVRSGAANKTDGKMSSYPGKEGGGSLDLEVCLAPETMEALMLDPEFMAAVSG